MKIVKLEAEGFKRLRAVEISPDGALVTIGGKNGAGKSSVLDSVWVAVKGVAAAPPKPIREGEEQCRLHLDLGEIIITRTFTAKDDGSYTHKVKVENAEGLRYGEPQKILNGLLGAVGFDPFEFMNLKADVQAERLLELVPLPIDLDELAELDTSDYAKRRDVNRDGVALKAQLEGIPKEEVPEEIADRDELVAKLGNASNHNLAIERESMRRESQRSSVAAGFAERDRLRAEAERLREAAASCDADADALNTNTMAAEKELAELPELDTPVDVHELQEEIRRTENLIAIKNRQDRRAEMATRLEELRAESQGYTDAMEARDKQREEALSKAKMPVEGLGFSINEKGKPVVTYQGLPFDKDQISTAAALRVSTAIAMAANPTLRVLQIRDGSLLDEDSMKVIGEMAAEQDYQVWIERVGTEGVGIIIEDGAVQGEETPESNTESKTPAAKAPKQEKLV